MFPLVGEHGDRDVVLARIGDERLRAFPLDELDGGGAGLIRHVARVLLDHLEAALAGAGLLQRLVHGLDGDADRIAPARRGDGAGAVDVLPDPYDRRLRLPLARDRGEEGGDDQGTTHRSSEESGFTGRSGSVYL